MTVPTNDARALHNLLELVGSGSSAPQNAWATVLGAEYGSLEFANRHSEVAGLYVGTMTQVRSLPDRSRERFERYAWNWWMGIVAPQHGWSNSVQMSGVVDSAALDQLGSAADLIESRMSGSLAVPGSNGLEDLQVICQEWIDAVLPETEIAEPLKTGLLQDLQHIIWLIEHADVFGVARVVAAGQRMVGSVIVVSGTLPPTKHGVWVERGKKLVAAIVLIGALHDGIDTTLMLGEGARQFLSELSEGSSPEAPGAPGHVADPEQDET